MKCYQSSNEGLTRKGVRAVVDCIIEGIDFKDVEDLMGGMIKVLNELPFHHIIQQVVFDSNEPIGSSYMLYRFRGLTSGKDYIGIRAVVRRNRVNRVLFTIPSGLDLGLDFPQYRANSEPSTAEGSGVAPGQTYIPNMVIYNILGVPEIDVSRWKLEVEGDVANPLQLTLSELYELGMESVVTDFHCVTGWSVKGVEFSGVSLRKLLNIAEVGEEAKWLIAYSADGYSAVIPLGEALRSNSLVALEMNGEPLDILHGYPARLLFPHLYGWKSVKWVTRIRVSRVYEDGYWEALGYHPRGRADLEERFK